MLMHECIKRYFDTNNRDEIARVAVHGLCAFQRLIEETEPDTPEEVDLREPEPDEWEDLGLPGPPDTEDDPAQRVDTGEGNGREEQDTDDQEHNESADVRVIEGGTEADDS